MVSLDCEHPMALATGDLYDTSLARPSDRRRARGGLPATVLTFNITGATDGSLLPQGYGDNVASLTNGTFSYGAGGGFTPDVTVDYLGSGGQTDLNFWANGFNDLTNVVEYEPDGESGYSITFTAAAGKTVSIDSFDLGNYGEAVTLPRLWIVDGAGTVLFDRPALSIANSNAPHLSFTPGVTATTLRISLDLTGLGGNSDNMGLDNIQFRQTTTAVPEPATLATLGLGLAAILRRRRRSA